MSNYEVDVLVRSRPIRQFKHKSDLFVEGRKGSEFELKFTNNTWQRVEIVPSVDGLSVMDGEECGVGSDGYLVPARQSIVIPGWRLDNDNIAKFIFKGKNKSYTAKAGHGTDNVGVIGFMVFAEKQTVFYPQPYPIFTTREVHHHHHHNNPVWPSYGSTSGVLTGSGSGEWLSTSNAGANSIASNSVSIQSSSLGKMAADEDNSDETFNLGVGFGEEDSHKVHEVAFTRANATVPESILTVYYDSRKGLEARGIQVVKSKKKTVSELPNPFPTYSGSGCTPPSGWKRNRR